MNLDALASTSLDNNLSVRVVSKSKQQMSNNYSIFKKISICQWPMGNVLKIIPPQLQHQKIIDPMKTI